MNHSIVTKVNSLQNLIFQLPTMSINLLGSGLCFLKGLNGIG